MKNIARNLLALALVTTAPLLTSCAATKEIPLSDSSALRGKTLVRVTRKTPAFSAMTATKMGVGSAFGAIGGAIAAATAVSEGNQIVRENHVEDPAVSMSRDLATGMSKTYGMKLAGDRHVEATEPADIAKACSGADYALDARTINWSLMYFPGQLRTYRVIYSSQLRLIDCRSGQVVAQGFNLRDPQEEEHSYSYDGLVENGANNLKKESKIAGNTAKNHFKSSVLKY